MCVLREEVKNSPVDDPGDVENLFPEHHQEPNFASVSSAPISSASTQSNFICRVELFIFSTATCLDIARALPPVIVSVQI